MKNTRLLLISIVVSSVILGVLVYASAATQRAYTTYFKAGSFEYKIIDNGIFVYAYKAGGGIAQFSKNKSGDFVYPYTTFSSAGTCTVNFTIKAAGDRPPKGTLSGISQTGTCSDTIVVNPIEILILNSKTGSPGSGGQPGSSGAGSGSSGGGSSSSSSSSGAASTGPQKPDLPKVSEAKTPFFTTMFDSYLGGKCKNSAGQVTTYECWISAVWNWAMIIIVPIAALVLAAAGVVYNTSGGNPDRIALAKKLMLGVASGLGLLVISKILLLTIIGTGSGSWNV